MLITDMHCDSLTRVTAERGLKQRYNFSFDNPQLQFVAAFVDEGGNAAEARREVMHLLDVYIAERARLDLVPVYGCHDIDFALATDRSASIFSIEGGGGLRADSDELVSLYNAGLRVLGLAWKSNPLATASGDTSGVGLTDLGRSLALRATEMGIILDISHLSDRAAEELLDLSPYPMLATHSNLRAVADHPRNLPTDIARKLTARGGVIGISLYPPHLSGDNAADLNDIYRHVDFCLERFGEASVGFGFDIDGTKGKYPTGLDETDSIHDRVVDMLAAHYSDSIVTRIASTNVIDFLKSNL